jgi:3-oxoacyl-[acyl-carrier protein] reductase
MEKPKVAVVTGAASGIGRATAIEFAKRGWLVIAHGHRNLAGLEETQRRILDIVEKHSHSASYVSDIASSVSNRSLVEAIFTRFGSVDAWINAAGADVLTGEVSRASFSEKLTRLWEVDVCGTMLLSRLVAHRMIVQRSSKTSFAADSAAGGTLPSIIHLGWDQAEHGMEGDSGQYFSATKAAVAAFSKSLAKSAGPYVRVNCIAPGWVKTEWGANAATAWQQRAIGESILQRWGRAEDIAGVIAAVAAGDLAFVNGQTIAVNGGWQSMTLSVQSETHWTH